MNTKLSWIVVGVLIAAAFAGSAIAYQFLPTRIPIHWNIEGKADGFGDKVWAVWLMPLTMLGMALLLAALPWFSPKPFSLDTFRSTYQFIIVLVVGLLGVIHAITLTQTFLGHLDLSRLFLVVLFLFFALLGNVMGKIKRNLYVGIKVPWTLANDRVWNDTHRLAAHLWVAAGLIGVALVWLPAPWFMAAFGVLLIAVFVPIGFSFVLYKRLERQGEI
jgi:uncharacterized membrane protein